MLSVKIGQILSRDLLSFDKIGIKICTKMLKIWMILTAKLNRPRLREEGKQTKIGEK
jgi:hypothetical protein